MAARLATAALLSVLVSVLALPGGAAQAHPAGDCRVDLSDERCERWSHVHDDPDTAPPARSDQFVTAAAASDDTVFLAIRNVALDPTDPYNATGSWLVVAHDAVTGELRWRAVRRTRHYDSVHDVAVSPDGSRVYVTGAAYSAYVATTPNDSRMVTVAYDAATGSELWSRTWDNGTPDADNIGKVVTVSPDGREVYVGGVTTSTGDDLDYAVVAYDTRRARELWSMTWQSPQGGATDALFDLAVTPDGQQVVATGYSMNQADYDHDYVTLALRTTRRAGSIAWLGRYDAGQADRASSVAIAPDGTVAVSGNSLNTLTGDFDAVTIAYDASGTQRWVDRSAGAYGGFTSGRDIAATPTGFLVTSQSSGADADSGFDTQTQALDLATGAPRWVHREEAPRNSELPTAIEASPDGLVAYVLTSARPVVDYTSLDEIVLHAYRVADGAELWTSRLDSGLGNALAARALTVSGAGAIVVGGQVTLSQNPLGVQSQNRYDALLAVFDPAS